MEFKGTKGKQKVGRKSTKNNIGRFQCYVSNGKIIDSPICTVFGETNEQTDATALLISKAPEMLDMLEELCENLAFQLDRLGVCGEGDGIGRKADVESYGGTELLHKAKQLIKETTEI